MTPECSPNRHQKHKPDQPTNPAGNKLLWFSNFSCLTIIGITIYFDLEAQNLHVLFRLPKIPYSSESLICSTLLIMNSCSSPITVVLTLVQPATIYSLGLFQLIPRVPFISNRALLHNILHTAA